MKYSLTELLLNEYSDKTINQMLALYKPQTTDSEDQIKKNIKRFEQLTTSIASKLANNNPAVIRSVPQDLQQNNKFRDITNYKDYNILVRVLKSTDTKETDLYKAAIEYFKKKDRTMDPSIIGKYVGQFKKNKDNLEQAVQNQDQNVLNLIPSELISKGTYSNILSYKNFRDLEHLIDGAFPFPAGEKQEINSVDIEADRIYNNTQDGIEIYKGDAEHKCIKYGKNQYYGWCISRTTGSLYGSYRFGSTGRFFYFVVDRTQPDTKINNNFVNPYHTVVIHAYEDGKYSRTTAQNDGDLPYSGATWDELGQLFTGEDGKRMWDKIKNLQKYFVYSSPSREERVAQGFKGQKLDLNQFIDLDQEDKNSWLQVNAANRDLVTSTIVNSLTNEQINDLINNGRVFTFDELKKSVGLLKRYADFRFVQYPNGKPLPYVFIPYLKPVLQRQYYDKYQDYLSFPLIVDIFPDDIIQKNIQDELDQLGFLPPEAKKYMTPQQLQLYNLYSLAFKNAQIKESPGSTGLALSQPVQVVTIPTLSQKSFSDLTPNEKKQLVGLYNKLKDDPKNIEKFSNFFFGFPLMFEINNKTYYLLSSNTDDTFAIVDENNNILYDDLLYVDFIKDGKPIPRNSITGKATGSNSIDIKSSDFDSINVSKPSKDASANRWPEKVNISKQQIEKQIQEALIRQYNNHKFLHRAGIIK